MWIFSSFWVRLILSHRITQLKPRTFYKGTGKNGRIMKSDVLEFVENGQVATSSPAQAEQQQQQQAPPTPQVTTPVRPVRDVYDSLSFCDSNTNTKQVQTSTEPTIVPVKGIQKAMLQSMTQSLTIPHFGYCDEIEMTKAMEFRRQLNNSPETKVTMMPILLKAASLALKSYPVLNSSLSECQTQLVQHASHNMGFAMDTPRGLLVRGVRA